eukprot:m.3974 g.3974  ORF g.3974 m.3974 type:complete len:341 (-) comp2861_c0_seq1:26-1048(-)
MVHHFLVRRIAQVFGLQDLRVAIMRPNAYGSGAVFNNEQHFASDRWSATFLRTMEDSIPSAEDKKKDFAPFSELYLVGREPQFGPDDMYTKSDVRLWSIHRSSHIELNGGSKGAAQLNPPLKPFLEQLRQVNFHENSDQKEGHSQWNGVPLDEFKTLYQAQNPNKLSMVVFPRTLHTYGHSGISEALSIPASGVMFVGGLGKDYDHAPFYQEILDAAEDKDVLLEKYGIEKNYTVEIRKFLDQIDVTDVNDEDFNKILKNSVSEDMMDDFWKKYGEAEVNGDGRKLMTTFESVVGTVCDGTVERHKILTDLIQKQPLPDPGEVAVCNVGNHTLTEGYLRM